MVVTGFTGATGQAALAGVRSRYRDIEASVSLRACTRAEPRERMSTKIPRIRVWASRNRTSIASVEMETSRSRDYWVHWV